jgi:hypothetical protein
LNLAEKTSKQASKQASKEASKQMCSAPADYASRKSNMKTFHL